jgi:hypothetical protein
MKAEIIFTAIRTSRDDLITLRKKKLHAIKTIIQESNPRPLAYGKTTSIEEQRR